MTRKDYVAIAKRFNWYLVQSNAAPNDRKGAQVVAHQKRWIASLAGDIAQDMAQDNPRFDRARFLAACGISAVQS